MWFDRHSSSKYSLKFLLHNLTCPPVKSYYWNLVDALIVLELKLCTLIKWDCNQVHQILKQSSCKWYQWQQDFQVEFICMNLGWLESGDLKLNNKLILIDSVLISNPQNKIYRTKESETTNCLISNHTFSDSSWVTRL